jgi:hypothetical protein
MAETLTVLKLELPSALRGFLITTNEIENLIGSAHRTSRNVTRWRSGQMILRWTAVGLLHAEQSFRRIRGYRHLPLLKRARREQPSKLDLNRGGCVVKCELRLCAQIPHAVGHRPRFSRKEVKR